MFLVLIMVVITEVFHFTVFYFLRLSLSLLLGEEAIRLPALNHIAWNLKDTSMQSFPGDHGTVLFVLATLIAYFAGWQAGIAAFFPRTVLRPTTNGWRHSPYHRWRLLKYFTNPDHQQLDPVLPALEDRSRTNGAARHSRDENRKLDTFLFSTTR